MGINEIVKIGNKIKKLRLDKGYSQKKMAELVGIPYSTYSNYENNNREPNIATLTKIAEVLEIDIFDLFEVPYEEEESESNIAFSNKEFTKEELESIKQFAEFIKTKRSINIADLFSGVGGLKDGLQGGIVENELDQDKKKEN